MESLDKFKKEIDFISDELNDIRKELNKLKIITQRQLEYKKQVEEQRLKFNEEIEEKIFKFNEILKKRSIEFEEGLTKNINQIDILKCRREFEESQRNLIENFEYVIENEKKEFEKSF